MTKRLVLIAKLAVPILVSFFIGRTIYGNWQQVRDAEWQFAPFYLILSFALSAPWFVVRPWGWKFLIRCFGYDLPYAGSFRLVREAEISRYVPGTVWQYLSRVYLASRWGVPATATLAATLVESVFLLLAVLPPALWNLRDVLPVFGRYHFAVSILILAASIAVVHPRILNWWVGMLARYAKRPYRELRIGWGALASIWTVYMAMWILTGFGVAFFVRGVIVIPIEDFPRVAGDYLASWAASLLTVIAPAGMGIREGILGLRLRRLMPVGTAFTMAVAIRLWLTLLELLMLVAAQRMPSGSAAAPEQGATASFRQPDPGAV